MDAQERAEIDGVLAWLNSGGADSATKKVDSSLKNPLIDIKVPQEYRDAMGHMNIRHYMAVFDDAEFALNAVYGMDNAYFSSSDDDGDDETTGLLFDLTHHVRYLKEVAIGSRLRAFGRTLGVAKSGRRVHFKLYLVLCREFDEDEEEDKEEGNNVNARVHYTDVAATLETLQAHVSKKTRQMSAFPPRVRALVDDHLSLSDALPFKAALCGSIEPR